MQEVFAVTVLPGKRYPDLINDDEKLLENSFVVPDAALADVPMQPVTWASGGVSPPVFDTGLVGLTPPARTDIAVST